MKSCSLIAVHANVQRQQQQQQKPETTQNERSEKEKKIYYELSGTQHFLLSFSSFWLKKKFRMSRHMFVWCSKSVYVVCR